MVDRLRLLWNRPLRDADRRRLFAVAFALIAAAAALLPLLERPARTAPPQRPSPAPAAPAVAVLEPVPVAPDEPAGEGARTPVAVSRADVAASKRAARRFLAGYLPYTYGRLEPEEIRAATAALRRRLAAEPPRVPAGERRSAPRVVLLQSNTVGSERAGLTALVDDGRRRYSVALALVMTGAGWRVARVGS